MSFANGHISRLGFWSPLVLVLSAIVVQGCACGTSNPAPAESSTPAPTTAPVAQVSPQSTFNSPDAAASALVEAMRAGDTDQIRQILGPDSDNLIWSGDPVADQQARQRFVAAYDKKHQIAINNDGSATLMVGDNDWPTPIPIVKSDQSPTWSFNTAAGKDEIINRRIGHNELTVIQVCKAIVDAQQEYAHRDPDNDGIPEYARKFISDPGTKDGLYWETAEGEQPSPLGALVAEAEANGYSTQPPAEGEPHPFHGYLYRIITAQGPNAPGGAMDYVINGKLIGGFAVVAWPADYGNSGIMTFIVNYSGDVYQSDLGPDTDKIARAMTAYDPGPDWKKAQ